MIQQRFMRGDLLNGCCFVFYLYKQSNKNKKLQKGNASWYLNDGQREKAQLLPDTSILAQTIIYFKLIFCLPLLVNMQKQYRGKTSTQYIIFTESRLYSLEQSSKQEQQRLKVREIFLNSKYLIGLFVEVRIQNFK